MGWSNHKLTKPFTKIALNGRGDLQLALHSSKMTQIELFANGIVALFAKYKAFKNGNVFLDSYADANSARKAALIAANYGVGIPTDTALGSPTTTSSFFYNLLTSAMMWYYDRPTVQTGKLRAEDFEGYIDNPEPLMLQNAITSYALQSDGSLELQWPMSSADPSEDSQLQYSDIKIGGVALANCYFGVLVYDTSSHYTWIAGDLVSNGLNATLSDMGTYAGKTVLIVPFVSTVQITQGGTPVNPVLASFNLAPISATINAHAGTWDIHPGTNQWNNAYTQISYGIIVSNNAATQKTMQFYIGIAKSPNPDTFIAQDTQLVTLNGNSQTTLTGTFNYTRVDMEEIYVVVSGNYAGEVVQQRAYMIMEPTEPIH